MKWRLIGTCLAEKCVVIQCSFHYRLHSPIYSLPAPGDEASCPGVQDVVMRGVYQQNCDDSLVAPSTLSPGSQQGTAENQDELFSFGSPHGRGWSCSLDTSSKTVSSTTCEFFFTKGYDTENCASIHAIHAVVVVINTLWFEHLLTVMHCWHSNHPCWTGWAEHYEGLILSFGSPCCDQQLLTPKGYVITLLKWEQFCSDHVWEISGIFSRQCQWRKCCEKLVTVSEVCLYSTDPCIRDVAIEVMTQILG